MLWQPIPRFTYISFINFVNSCFPLFPCISLYSKVWSVLHHFVPMFIWHYTKYIQYIHILYIYTYFILYIHILFYGCRRWFFSMSLCEFSQHLFSFTLRIILQVLWVSLCPFSFFFLYLTISPKVLKYVEIRQTFFE